MRDFILGLRNNFLFHNKADVFVTFITIGIILMILLPLTGILLDFLLAMNLIFSLLLILIVLFSRRALDFSVFPTLLLMSTVFNLALNISSTRLILSDGILFNSQIIRTFASFVVGSSGAKGIVIGIIIFVIIMAVQFIVITKGSTRIAEVAARFTLDALPGKQMAIDASYSSGLISEEEAKHQKDELQSETNFYGAMDGASKFVSGNVKVGIFITLINSIGGLFVGKFFHQQNWIDAFNTYVNLTIGDGLVSQLPALLISVSTGLMVTRAISDNTFAKDVTQQFSQQKNIYWIAAIFLLILAFVPGFPKIVLIPLSISMFYVAYYLQKSSQTDDKQDSKKQNKNDTEEVINTDIAPVIFLDTLSLELGYGLIPLVDKEKGQDFLNRITKLRREIALDIGLMVPKIRILDNMKLNSNEYVFKIRGLEVSKSHLHLNKYMLLNPDNSETIKGEITKDPVFGLNAIWIDEEQYRNMEKLGYTIVDPPSIIITHLTEIIRKHASELLGRKEVQTILDALKDTHGIIVEEIRKYFSVGDIQKILQGLLREQVSIRNIVSILEIISDYVNVTKDSHFLIEKVRQGLGRQICLQLIDEDKVLYCLSIDPDVEKLFLDNKVELVQSVGSSLDPDVYKKWLLASSRAFQLMQEKGYFPVILTSEASRILIKNSLNRDFSEVVVLSISELSSDIRIEIVEEINFDNL